MRQFLIVAACAAAISGCGRSPAEQLAYDHAEAQYQINRENAARYRQSVEDAANEEVKPREASPRPRS